MNAIRKIGMLGLGKMGAPMAKHLLARGFNVCGFDPVDPPSLGIAVMESAAAVADASDLVIVVVGFDHEVEAVLFGNKGVAAGARPGLIVAIGSTIAPKYAK